MSTNVFLRSHLPFTVMLTFVLLADPMELLATHLQWNIPPSDSVLTHFPELLISMGTLSLNNWNGIADGMRDVICVNVFPRKLMEFPRKDKE